MAHFCSNCGAQLRNPGALFCPTCGYALRRSADQPHLLLQIPGQPPSTVPLSNSLRIGRDPDNQLVLSLQAVSRHHALVEQQNGGFYIQDLESTNGTYVNNQRLRAYEPHLLNAGDMIRIGDRSGNSVHLEFKRVVRETEPSIPHPAPGTVRLTPLRTEESQIFTLGRAPENHLVLPHPAVSRRHAEIRNTSQGPQIFDLDSQNGTFINGQPVRRAHPLQVGDIIQIGPFKIVYGQEGSRLLDPHGNYRIDALKLLRKVSKRGWIERILRGKEESVILKDIDLSIRPREFVALVGGSGAGKSTLLKALSGFAPADGNVYVNGDDLYTNFAAYRHILGYVPQDDIIHSLLPVRNALRYAAQLRLPDLSWPEINDRINTVLQQVEMEEHADKQISSLSGGQRKRVSIAVELLAEPYLFFLDEPTSGLDPGLEKKMMFTLRKLADEGRTIVLVTHATANIEQCTHVAFMADGHMPFFGPPREALTFFGAEDFADIYTRLSQPLDGSEPIPEPLHKYLQALQQKRPGDKIRASELWTHHYKQSAYSNKYVEQRGTDVRNGSQQSNSTVENRSQRVSALKQFAVLSRRYFHLIRRDTMSLFILLAVMPVLGFLLLLMTNKYDLVGKPAQEVRREIQSGIAETRAQNDPRIDDETFSASYVVASPAQRLLFMLALAASLLGLFAAAYEIIKEAPIYKRERMVNLKIAPYLLSKLTVLGLFALLQAFLLLLVVGLKVDYPKTGIILPPVIEMYITLFLATMASIGLGMLISAVAKNRDMVIYIVLVILFVQIMFAGAIFDLPALARPISYLTTTRWTLEALGSIADLPALNDMGITCVEFEDETTQRLMDKAERPCEDGQLRQPATVDFNVNYKASASHLVLRWFILVLFTVGAGVTTYHVQKRKDVLS